MLKLIDIVIVWAYYTIPVGFSWFRHFLGITFQHFKLLCLAKDHWRGFSTWNVHMVHVVNQIRIKMAYASKKKSLFIFLRKTCSQGNFKFPLENLFFLIFRLEISIEYFLWPLSVVYNMTRLDLFGIQGFLRFIFRNNLQFVNSYDSYWIFKNILSFPVWAHYTDPCLFALPCNNTIRCLINIIS